MKISIARRSQAGVALLTAMIIVIIVGGMAAAFLTLSTSQSRLISNGSDQEIALHIAEAGIEDTLNKLTAFSQGYINNNNVNPTTPAGADYLLIGGPGTFVQVNGTAVATIVIGGSVNGGTYTAWLQNTTPGAATVFTGVFAPPTGAAPPNGYLITSAGTFNKVTRTIQIVTQAVNNNGVFQGGLFGNVQVDALGTFFSDGFNSAKGTYASQATNSYTFPGGKTFTYADTTGSIGSNGNIITNGNVTVMGNSTPGPGGTSGPGGNVWGSTTPATSPTPLPPVNYNVPSTALAAPSWTSNTGMTLAGSSTGAPVAYHMSSFSPNGKGSINITGNVTLYVDGAFSMNNQQALNIAAGAKLTVYQGPGSNDMTVNGQAIAGSGTASQFQIYSASTGSIKFNGGSTVYAYMYAPDATFTNNGGNEFFGAMIAQSMKLSGTASFHYDEALANLAAPIPDFKIVSWVEIPNQ